MKGNIIGFDPDTNTGAISGHDGNRYEFVTLDWRAPSRPRRGDLVDFQAIDHRATEIYLVEAQYIPPSLGGFYFSLNGRISRSQYWLRFMLPYFAIAFVLQIAAGLAAEKTVASSMVSTLQTIFSLVAFWPSIAILIKRIHDRDKPGWTCLFLYVPVTLFIIFLGVWIGGAFAAAATGAALVMPPLGTVGAIVIVLAIASSIVGLWFFVEFGCLRGTVGSNRYGPDPVR